MDVREVRVLHVEAAGEGLLVRHADIIPVVALRGLTLLTSIAAETEAAEWHHRLAAGYLFLRLLEGNGARGGKSGH